MPHLLGHLSIDGISTVASTITAIVSLAVTLWFFWLSRRVRSISYSVSALPGRGVVHWTLTNAGTVGVTAAEIERPIALVFDEGSEPQGPIRLVSESPAGLNPQFVVGRNRLIFVQQLLNAGDSFTVSAIVANYRGPPRIDGRVADIPEIIDAAEATRRKQALSRRLLLSGATAVAAVVAVVVLSASPSRSRAIASHHELGLAVRSWSIVGAPFRGQYEFVLGVNAYANGSKAVDVRLDRFRLLVSTLDAAHWAPPQANLSHGATQLDFEGKRVWAVPATANGVSALNLATGTRTVPSLWSARTLQRGQSYPARPPDGVMTFYLPRSDILNKGALDRVIGLAYVSTTGKVLLVDKPGAWGPRLAAAHI